MSFLYAASVGQNDITVYALPQLPDPMGLGGGASVVATIPLDPGNKSLPDYTRLLREHGWELKGKWDTTGKWPRVDVSR